MTIWSQSDASADDLARRRWALYALYLVLPWLALGYQIAAKQAAGALSTLPFGWAWLLAAAGSPWGQAMLAFEIASFAAWMLVLEQMKLGAAFSLSAISYVLVIGASWGIFHEQSNARQVMGSAAILAGVWLIGRKPETDT